MKKALLASSALIGASMLATTAQAGTVGTSDTMSVTLSGYHIFQASATDFGNDSLSRGRGYRFSTQDTELQWVASAKTDSGITYGFNFQLDMAGAQDETFGFISGEFGTLRFGNEDGAANLMTGALGAGAANSTRQGLVGGLYGLSHFDKQAGADDAQLMISDNNPSSDSNKIVYLSPRVSGFQIGASWTPDAGSEGADGFDDNVGSENIGELAVNYTGETSGAAFRVGASYQFSDDQEAAGVNMEDFGITQVGVDVTMNGLTLGATYRHNGDQGVALNDEGDGGNWWGLGARYAMGPWTFQASVAKGTQDFGAGALEQQNKRFGAGVGYAVAPGWAVSADYLAISRENNNGAATDEDASAIILTNTFSF